MNFLKAIPLAGVLILAIACGSADEQKVSGVSFTNAVVHPEMRATYLMQLVQRVGKPSYVTVGYDDTLEEFRVLQETYGFQMRPGIAMATNWGLPRLGDLGKRQVPVRISVFPSAFQPPFLKGEDFLSSFLHELDHADTLQTGRIGRFSILPIFLAKGGNLNEDLVLSVMELEALKNEIARQEISEGYFQSRVNLYMEHYLELWKYAQGMDEKVVEELKVEFFHRGMLNHPYFSREARESSEVWYLRNPVSGKTYEFSPAEIEGIRIKLAGRK